MPRCQTLYPKSLSCHLNPFHVNSQFTNATNKTKGVVDGDYLWTPPYNTSGILTKNFSGAAIFSAANVAARTYTIYPALTLTTPFVIAPQVASFIANLYEPNAVSSQQFQNEVKFVLEYGYAASSNRSDYDSISILLGRWS